MMRYLPTDPGKNEGSGKQEKPAAADEAQSRQEKEKKRQKTKQMPAAGNSI